MCGLGGFRAAEESTWLLSARAKYLGCKGQGVYPSGGLDQSR